MEANTTIKVLLRWNAAGNIQGFSLSAKGNYRVVGDITHFSYQGKDMSQQASQFRAIIIFRNEDAALLFQAECAEWRQDNLEMVGNSTSFNLCMELYEVPAMGDQALLIMDPDLDAVCASMTVEPIQMRPKTISEVEALFSVPPIVSDIITETSVPIRNKTLLKRHHE